jgi:hypothetical protein
MNAVEKVQRCRPVPAPALRTALGFLAGATATLILVSALNHGRLFASQQPLQAPNSAAVGARQSRAQLPLVAFAPTFADAAAALKAARFAQAYGQFVSMADDGDVDAARMALVMHRLGPRLFGSDWDASIEQLAEWTLLSRAAEEEDLRQLRAIYQPRGGEVVVTAPR